MKRVIPLFILGFFVYCNCKAIKPGTIISITLSGVKQKTLRIHKGDTLLVKLQMASGTGFVWQVSVKPIFCNQEDTKYEHIKSNMPGAPLMEIMRFTMTSSGVEDIVFIYHRPFDKNKTPAKTKTLHLIVQ